MQITAAFTAAANILHGSYTLSPRGCRRNGKLTEAGLSEAFPSGLDGDVWTTASTAINNQIVNKNVFAIRREVPRHSKRVMSRQPGTRDSVSPNRLTGSVSLCQIAS